MAGTSWLVLQNFCWGFCVLLGGFLGLVSLGWVGLVYSLGLVLVFLVWFWLSLLGLCVSTVLMLDQSL